MSTVGRQFLDTLARRYEADQRVKIGRSPDPEFRLLERRFPMIGSKIDWNQVPGAVVMETDLQDHDRHGQDALSLLIKVSSTVGIASEQNVIAIGDSAMEVAVSLPFQVLLESIRDFLELPQHLYVLPEDGGWCFSFTMEGFLAFGRAPFP